MRASAPTLPRASRILSLQSPRIALKTDLITGKI